MIIAHTIVCIQTLLLYYCYNYCGLYSCSFITSLCCQYCHYRSEGKVCGICMEVVLEKPVRSNRRFGILCKWVESMDVVK